MRRQPVFGLLSVVLVTVLIAGVASATETTDVQAILDGLTGLPFDDFVDRSYEEILLRSPQEVTSLGLAQALGISNDRLDAIC